MTYTNEEIARALSLAVTWLDAAYINERERYLHFEERGKLAELDKAIKVLTELNAMGVDRIAPTFGDKNDPIS